MTEHELYHAIGNVDEAFLLECEDRPIRRIPKRFGLIAAVVALMLTACAPAAIQAFTALKEGSVSRTESYRFYELEPAVYEIRADIDIAQDAPTTIETVYFPTAMKNYGSEITCDKKEWAVSFYLTDWQDDPKTYINFHQTVYSADDRTGETLVLGEFHASSDAEPQVTEKTFGDITVLDIIHESPAWKRGSGAYYSIHRNIFWSDGYYLFFMNLPPSWNDEQVEEMVTSLTAMEDLSEFQIQDH